MVRAGSSPDVVVIGAGIVGAACAAALARTGRRVLVVERDFPAGGTTAAGMGHLVAMDDSPAQLALTAYSLRRWRELLPALGHAVEYDGCGTLWVATDDSQLGALALKRDAYAAAGVRAEVLDAQALATAEPNLRPGLAGALLVPDDAVVYPPGAAAALLDLARASGAVVRTRADVAALGVHEVRLASERIACDTIVVAAGASAASLLPQLPIVPRKGHLVVTDRYPGFCRHQLVELGYLASAHTMSTESVAFNVQPRPTGQILIGSSRELVGWEPSINRDLLRRMLERAIDFMPALERLSAIRTWTGFRPATPDKLPLIGAWSDLPGTYVAAGHEGLGITTATGTAQLLADLIAGEPTAIDATPFAPDRVLATAGVE
jgi:glycine/D-amino acid oxidase-like deaminating enzyme